MRKGLLALFLLQIVLYWNLLQADFIFDDRILILRNQDLDLNSIWFLSLWRKIEEALPYYRPVFMSSILLDTSLFGSSPVGYHIHNFLWHLCSVFLFFSILHNKSTSLQLTDEQTYLATAIFSFHPIVSEGVYWISARNDSLYLSFSLLSIFCLWRERPKYFWGGLSFLLALLSKETTIALFAAIVISGKLFDRKSKYLLSAIFGLLLCWRWYIGVVATSISFAEYKAVLPFLPAVFIEQFSSLLWSWPLSIAASVYSINLAWWQYISATIAIVLLGYFAWKDQAYRFWVSFGLFAILLAIPSIVTFKTFGDRYWIALILPWSIVIAKIFHRYIILFFLSICSVFDWTRGLDYENNYQFWESEYRHYPSSYSAVGFANISYEMANAVRQHDPEKERYLLTQAYQLYKEGYSYNHPLFIHSCSAFLTASSKLHSPQQTLEDAIWMKEIGCEYNDTSLGLLAIIHAHLGNWSAVDKIIAEQPKDPHHRFDIVQALVALRHNDAATYCRIEQEFSSNERLQQQIRQIAPTQNIVDCQNMAQ